MNQIIKSRRHRFGIHPHRGWCVRPTPGRHCGRHGSAEPNALRTRPAGECRAYYHEETRGTGFESAATELTVMCTVGIVWIDCVPSTLCIGIGLFGGSVCRFIFITISRNAQPRVRRMFWVLPSIPNIWALAGLSPTLVFRVSSTINRHGL